MHELSIAESILDIVRQYVPEQQRKSVRSVRVQIGQIAGVVPDSLGFCFQAITAGTQFEGSSLDLDLVPLRLKCGGCGAVSTSESGFFMCPLCGSGETTLLSGNELRVSEIELSDAEQEL